MSAMPQATLRLCTALVVALLAAGTLLAAPRVTLDAATGEVEVSAAGEPLGEVLAALGREAGVKLIVDAEVEPRPVTLTGRFPSGAAAVRAAASAARATVEEAGGVILVRRAREGAGAAAAPITITAGPDGLFRCPGTLGYALAVLGDGPADATLTAAFAGFEHRQGIGLISAREVQERAMREYLEARHVYRRVLARALSPIVLSDAVEQRQVRVYVDPPRDRMYAELLFPQAGTSGESAELVHVIYLLKAQTGACEAVVFFKRRIDWTPPPPPGSGW